MDDPSRNRLVISLVLLITLTAIAMIAIVYTYFQGLQEPISSLKIKAGTLIQVTAEAVINQSLEIGLPNGIAVVYIPANAISETGWFALSSKGTDLFPEAGQKGWSRPVIVHLELFDPNNILIKEPTFLKSVEICFPLGVNEWKQYQARPVDYKTQYFSEEGGKVWEDLPMVYRLDNRMLCGDVNHLGTFALAVHSPTQNNSTPIRPYTP